ncbi:MAG: hypothetical protein OXE02_08545 [Chloroflexi bacterium]|nr:hypothetical protein [Chloroflexota bacterium]
MDEKLRLFGGVLVKIGLGALAVAIALTLFWPSAPHLVQVSVNYIFGFGFVVGFVPTASSLISRHWPRW